MLTCCQILKNAPWPHGMTAGIASDGWLSPVCFIIMCSHAALRLQQDPLPIQRTSSMRLSEQVLQASPGEPDDLSAAALAEGSEDEGAEYDSDADDDHSSTTVLELRSVSEDNTRLAALSFKRGQYIALLAHHGFRLGNRKCSCGSPALVQCGDCNYDLFCLKCFERDHIAELWLDHVFYLPCPSCGRLASTFAKCSACPDSAVGCPDCLVVRNSAHADGAHAMALQLADRFAVFPILAFKARNAGAPSVNDCLNLIREQQRATMARQPRTSRA